MFAVLRSVIESQAIYAYVALLLDRMGGFDKAVESITELHMTGKFLATPPLCCCCKPCCPVIPMSRDLLVMCRRFAIQAVYCIPFLAYLHLWVQLEKATSTTSYYDIVIICIQVLEVATIMLAFWGMMILFFASRTLLAEFNPGKKMLAIKLVLFVGVVQTFALTIAISKAVDTSGDDLYDENYLVTAWTNFLLCLESAPLALLMRATYPVKELQFSPLINSSPKDVGYGATDTTDV